MARSNNGPLPQLPAKITIPNIKVTEKTVGELQIPASLPFYYAAIQSIWIWWQADLDVLRAYLEPLGMTPYSLGGKGAVNVNFFNAAALYGQGFPGNPGISGFNETEVNIVGYATKVGNNVPQGVTFNDYLMQGDQTKRVGNYRVWVACDNPIAVAAGRQLFFENKFLTPYTYKVPALNNQGQTTYDWTCHEASSDLTTIYDASVNLAGLSAVQANMSEVIDLSYDTKSKRPVGSRRNYFGMYDTYMIPPSNKTAVSLTYGKSKHDMRHDMERLIGKARALAIQVFSSPTCIAEASPYYADL